MHKSRLPRPPGPPWGRMHAALLALALLLAQTLGVLHRVEHPIGAPLANAGLHLHDHDEHADHHAEGLFGGHDDAADCRLFDQASTAEIAVFGLSPVCAPPAADSWLINGRSSPGRCVARCYHARAPPHLA